jgi:hypothetical protein
MSNQLSDFWGVKPQAQSAYTALRLALLITGIIVEVARPLAKSFEGHGAAVIGMD